jgi:hypothetical protein
MDINQAKDMATLKYGIVFPMTMDNFLKIRAPIIMKYHTDKNKDANTDEFIEVMEMFNVLKNNFDFINGFINTGEVNGIRTRSGDLLIDLGKGLGPLINGGICPDCKHNGYTIQEVPIFGTYNESKCDCDNGFIHSSPCRPCKGTGIFHTKSGFDVKCKACDGTKIHIFKTPIPCPKCSNKRKSEFSFFNFFFGYERIVGYRKEYHTCYKCKGTGEIEIHNPVFQKGAMQTGKVDKKVNFTNSAEQLKRYNKIMKGIKNTETKLPDMVLDDLSKIRSRKFSRSIKQPIFW